MISNFLDAFSGPGAAFMYAILVVLAYGLAIFIERLMAYNFFWKITEDQLRHCIRQGKFEEAAQNSPDHPVQQLLAATDADGQYSWDSLATAAPLVEEQIRRRVSSLATIANISTMLGLLGTVYGLIYALEGLDQASAIERTARLSSGIAAAMITTAWGLIVGVPALLAHSHIASRSDRILAFCESVAAEIMVRNK